MEEKLTYELYTYTPDFPDLNKVLRILGPDSAFNPGTKQAEVCGSLPFPGQPDPQNEFRDSLGLHSETPCQTKQNKTAVIINNCIYNSLKLCNVPFVEFCRFVPSTQEGRRNRQTLHNWTLVLL